MVDLIYREPLVKAMLEKSFYPAFVRRIIEQAPTVDAVEVVRCKDCKWWNENETDLYQRICRCERFSLVGYSENYTKPTDFCSYGERKDNG